MFKKILVGVTGAKNTLEVCKVGFSLAESNAELILLHVVHTLTDATRKQADAELEQVKKLSFDYRPVKMDMFVVEGDPKQKIVELAQRNMVDVVVLGAPTTSDNIPKYVMENAHCTVVLVKGKD